MKRSKLGMVLIFLLASVLVYLANVEPAQASLIQTIYIRSDGSIDPPTAPISTSDNVTYALTEDIINNRIEIQRSDITLDGNGYFLEENIGNETTTGILLFGIHNVSVRNVNFDYSGFSPAICLNSSYYCTIASSQFEFTNNVIDVINSSFNTISNNTLLYCGIHGVPISVHSNSHNNSIVSNTFDTCGLTIILNGGDSGNNTLLENRFVDVGIGVWLFGPSGGNVFMNNSFNNTQYKQAFIKDTSTPLGNDVDTSNTINGKPIYYLFKKQDTTVPADAACVILENCTRITVQYLDDLQNSEGLQMFDTTNSTVTKCNLNYLRRAIWLYSSDNNVISENNITDNREYGIASHSSSGNRVYHNNFVNNSANAFVFEPSSNAWDDGYPSGGNYWDDYTGVDLYRGPFQNITGSDGIGDTPYTTAGDWPETDRYPLTNLWHSLPQVHDVAVSNIVTSKTVIAQGHIITVNVTVGNQGGYAESFYVTAFSGSIGAPTSEQWDLFWHMGDVNRDGFIDDEDVLLVEEAFGSIPGDPNWNPDADVHTDGAINMFDVATVAKNYGENIWNYFGLGIVFGRQRVVDLPPEQSATIQFVWNTTGYALSNYTISASAEIVPEEVDTADNTLTKGWVVVTIMGDVDGNFKVDILDVVRITGIYGSARGDPDPLMPPFAPNSDLDDDGTITILDVVKCTTHYGEHYP